MNDLLKSVITCDLDGKVETFSEGAQKLFGYTLDEIIGKGRVSDFSPGQVVLGHVVNWLKESVGIQDQIMAAHGGFRIIEMVPDATWILKNMLLPKEYLKSLEDNVLLGFSGISRMAEQHAKNKIENIKQGKTNEELQTIFSLAQEALQAFQDQAGFDKIGRLLDQSWQCKRRLAEGVSANWIDDLYQTAIRNGAYGGKLMGAGGGGFFFFLAPPNKHHKIRDALSQIKVWVPFKIDHTGSQVIFYNEN